LLRPHDRRASWLPARIDVPRAGASREHRLTEGDEIERRSGLTTLVF
jgi:hypothetical protein